MVFLALVVVVGVCAVVAVLGVFAKYELKPRQPEIAPPTPTQPAPELLTRMDRWTNEQEHELYPTQTFQHKNCRVCGPGPLKRYQVPSNYDHVYYTHAMFRGDYGRHVLRQVKAAGPDEAEVVSSAIEGHPGWHTPMIDIDLPVRVLESSTPGHHHLYIDKPMRWRPYNKMLRAMYKAGVVEKGYYKASKVRKASHLRPPWVEKDDINE